MFPETRYSAVLLATSDDPNERADSVARLARIYYRPVYLHLRHKWKLEHDRAEDAAQAFFAAVAERNVFAAYRMERGRFRTFIRTCLDHLVEGEFRAARRLKRGGDKRFVPLDAESLENELVDLQAADPEKVFEQEFVRSLFSAVIAALKARLEEAGKGHYFALFEAYDLAPDPEKRPTYAELAKTHDLGATDVTNYLFFARKQFRRCVVEQLRELTSSDEEMREEAAELGIDIDAVQ